MTRRSSPGWQRIHLKLELAQTEKTVGPFYLDILAKAGETRQLSPLRTNWRKRILDLGQLLTYAGVRRAYSNLGRSRVHRRALHKLNQGKRKDSVLRRQSGSRQHNMPRAEVSQGVSAGFWNKDVTLPSGALSPLKRKCHDFFQQLQDGLTDAHSFHRPVIRFDYTGRLFRSRKDNRIGYAVYLGEGNDAWVTFHIEAKDKIQTKEIRQT